MRENIILTVGNGMMGDDGAGALLAQTLHDAPLEKWSVLNGGSAPENLLYLLRDYSPKHVLIIDAADMDLPPGSIRRIRDDLLDDPFLLTTHTLPLTYLMESLREFVPQVTFLGIQPETIAFGYPISASVKLAVSRVISDLRENRLDWLVHPPEEL